MGRKSKIKIVVKPEDPESTSGSSSTMPPPKKGRKTQAKSPTAASFVSPNVYDSLTEPETDDQSMDYQPVSNKKSQRNPQDKRMKPIIVETSANISLQNIKLLAEKLPLTSGFLLKHTHTNVQILTKNSKDKSTVVSSLKAINASFFSYTETSERDQIFVLKGHYYTEPEELLNKLKANNIPAIKVSHLGTNTRNPLFLVQFKRDEIQLSTLTYQHKVIDNLMVKWEKFKKSQTRVTQCKNCQDYGHGARQCGKLYRCVKCVLNHAPGECSRTTRDGNPTCINCQGDHAANSKVCKFYKEYLHKISRNKSDNSKLNFKNVKKPENPKKIPVRSDSVESIFNPSDFPPIESPQKTETPKSEPSTSKISNFKSTISNLKETVDIAFSEVFELRDELNSIEDIKETFRLMKELISKLKPTNCHKTRISYLLRLVI